MPTLQIQARALGDPTRHAIFTYLCDEDRPVDVEELTAHLGLNHNAIRQHLSKLVDAGLVMESVAPPNGRGRPRLRYTLDPSAESRWGVTGPYERLAMLLTEVVRSGESPVEIGRRAGLRRRLGTEPDQEPIKTFVDEMARMGFRPSVREKGDEVDMTVDECPFASAVLTDADTICSLHLGLALGVAEALGGIEVEELAPKDPRHAHCRLRCRQKSDRSA